MSCSIKWNATDDFFANQVVNERVINGRAEFFVRLETAANHIAFNLGDERLLLGMTRCIRAERIGQTMGEMSRSGIVLAFGGRNTLLVLIAVLRAEDTEVDIAVGSLLEVSFLCGEVSCRHVFEDKRHEELTEQTVCADIVA